jgi:isoquinoline 1-oxidoreductase
MDEWAEALNVDPVEFRLRHITDSRLRNVLETTAARFGWSRARRVGGRGVGVSCNIEKDARLALCVEVEVGPGAGDRDVRLLRMTAAGDFGAALNPDALKNQMTGAIVQGIGGALWERVHFDTLGQTTRHLARYRVPRFSDIPELDVTIVDRRDVASAGAGESPITLTAPALASALAAATGVRRRTLPLLE